MWIPYINDFRLATWLKLKDGVTVEERSETQDNMKNILTIVHLSIPYDASQIFGFLDDTGFHTTATGIGSHRKCGFYYDVQRSFYSTTFCGRGRKK